MTLIQRQYDSYENWSELIQATLLNSGRFERHTTSPEQHKNIDIFILKNDSDGSATNIEAGYLEDRLFYLNGEGTALSEKREGRDGQALSFSGKAGHEFYLCTEKNRTVLEIEECIQKIQGKGPNKRN